MDFFQRQDQARKNTKWLVVYFALAVAGIIAAVYLASLLVFAGVSAKTLKVGPNQRFTAPSQAIQAAADGDVIEIETGPGAIRVRHILYSPNGDPSTASKVAQDDPAWAAAKAKADAKASAGDADKPADDAKPEDQAAKVVKLDSFRKK